MTINATVVVGPTGVGKSKWAIEYAKQYGGTIINADSRQCYKACPILTARPTLEDEAECPHLGYGVLEADEQTNVGWWLKNTTNYITQTPHPIIVGGTGMYVSALLDGLSDIPTISNDILGKVENFTQKHDWMERIKKIDPLLPHTIVDPQRLKRALCVLWQTNQSITVFWKKKNYATPNLRARVVIVDMPMSQLASRHALRLNEMLQRGALEEVKRFLQKPESHYQGIIHALGFRHIMSYLRGQIAYDDMIIQTNQDTRQYAKRQRTWFRNQISPGPRVAEIVHINHEQL